MFNVTLWFLLALLIVGLSVWAILIWSVWRDFERSEKCIRDRLLEGKKNADHQKRGGEDIVRNGSL